MNNTKGKLIVLYGINNLGKTTQAKMLVKKLNILGAKSEYVKYPIYDLAPSGKIINNYLRGENLFSLSPREIQILFAMNRFQYQPTLVKKLKSGINIIAEDYTGTGIAWGMASGINKFFLSYLNSCLLKEDLAFLFDGKKYVSARENNHQYENNEILTARARQIHLELTEEYNWIKINTNSPRESIHNKILNETLKIIYFRNNNCAESQPLIRVKSTQAKRKILTLNINSTGIDLFSADYYTLLPFEKNAIQTGIKISIPKGYLGIIIDNNTIVNQGIIAANNIVEPEYKKEVTVNILNLSHDLFHIYPGKKIAQLLILKNG
ncbi:MAG: hypothetical protein U9R06_01750 [Patescibacteria group bacterium]|nr:hypothetical protein [Patescibacteria group bacterium]